MSIQHNRVEALAMLALGAPGRRIDSNATGHAGTSLLAIVDRLRLLRMAQRSSALCFVVATEGSTYRKTGSLALVSEDEVEGIISGGCLEPDLARQARECLRSGLSRCVVFDTASNQDLIYGSGSGTGCVLGERGWRAGAPGAIWRGPCSSVTDYGGGT